MNNTRGCLGIMNIVILFGDFFNVHAHEFLIDLEDDGRGDAYGEHEGVGS